MAAFAVLVVVVVGVFVMNLMNRPSNTAAAPTGHAVGNENAPVTVEDWSDFQ